MYEAIYKQYHNVNIDRQKCIKYQLSPPKNVHCGLRKCMCERKNVRVRICAKKSIKSLVQVFQYCPQKISEPKTSHKM